MLMLNLNDALDQLTMASNVCLYRNVFKMEDVHVWRKALYIWRVSVEEKQDKKKH